MKDVEHTIVKRLTVKKHNHATKITLGGKKHGGIVKPIKVTKVGVCAETLQQQYCHITKGSKLEI